MKKLLLTILSLICVFSLAFGMIGCDLSGSINLGGGNQNNNQNDDDTGLGGDNTDDDNNDAGDNSGEDNTDNGSNDNTGDSGNDGNDNAGDNGEDSGDSNEDDNQDNSQALPVFEQDGVTYTLDDGSYTVTACKSAMAGEEINILNSFNGISVTAIGEDAFRNNKKVVTVNLPDSVTYIGVSAFNTCSKLTTINLGKVKVIDKTAFKGSALNACDLSSLVEMGEGAFYSTKLKTVVIPNGITEIPTQAFSGCSILKTVELPSSVTTIGAKAFVNCSLLAIINLENVLYIEEYCFQSCAKLGAVTLTNAVYIKDWAFASTGIPSIVIGDKCEQVYMDAFDSCKSLQTITLQSADKFTWFFILETTGGTKYKIDQSTSYPAEWRNVWIKDPVLCRDFMSTRNHNKGCYIATYEWLAEHPM